MFLLAAGRAHVSGIISRCWKPLSRWRRLFAESKSSLWEMISRSPCPSRWSRQLLLRPTCDDVGLPRSSCVSGLVSAAAFGGIHCNVGVLDEVVNAPRIGAG